MILTSQVKTNDLTFSLVEMVTGLLLSGISKRLESTEILLSPILKNQIIGGLISISPPLKIVCSGPKNYARYKTSIFKLVNI